MRHFLKLQNIDTDTALTILRTAHEWKSRPPDDVSSLCLGRGLAMVFHNPSTRTRLSFDLAMQQMGGMTVTMDGGSSQMGRGETLHDTIRVLSGYVDVMMVRCPSQSDLEAAAKVASVPVINGLTSDCHPCQVMADMMTLQKRFSSLKDMPIAWVGDFNNVTRSWMWASRYEGCQLRVGCPSSLRPNDAFVDEVRNGGGHVTFYDNASDAVDGAYAVMTDTWKSMNTDDASKRENLLGDFAVTTNLMALAHKDGVFLHCLPATRGREVTDEVIDGKQSLVWECSANRLHVQKAILAWCLNLISPEARHQ